MTDRRPSMSDASIEQAFAYRAPHGADDGLLAEIVATAGRTSQRRTWRSALRSIGLGSRYTLVWLALALTSTLIAGLLLSGGLHQDRPDQAVVPPVPTSSVRPATPTPTVSAVPTPSASMLAQASLLPGHGRCDGITATVLTGTAMMPDTRKAFLTDVSGVVGAYVTSSSDATGMTEAEIWSKGRDRGPARRIATVGGSDLDHVSVTDVSPDGSTALVLAVSVAPSLGLTCAEPYLIDMDGSGAHRVTGLATWDNFPSAAFSPDGRSIAYTSWLYYPTAVLGAEDVRVTTMDLATGRETDSIIPCAMDAGGRGPVWAPDAAHLAVYCGSNVDIVDADGTGNATTIEAPAEDSFVRARWSGNQQLLLATSAFDVLTGDASSGHTKLHYQLAVQELQPYGTRAYPVAFSPSMDRVFATCCHPMPGHPEMYGYVIGLHRDLGSIAGIVPWDVAWSADGTALLFVDRMSRAPKLTRLTPTILSSDPHPAARAVILGDLPPDYSTGLWRMP